MVACHLYQLFIHWKVEVSNFFKYIHKSHYSVTVELVPRSDIQPNDKFGNFQDGRYVFASENFMETLQV